MTALKLVHSNLEPTGKRDYINRNAQLDPIMGVLFSDFISIYINRKKVRGKNLSRNYKTLVYHIDRFSKMYNANIYTNSVTDDFIYDFIAYLEAERLKHTYIKTIVDQVKSMAKKAKDSNYAVDMSFMLVELKPEMSYSIYLSEKEISRIYYFQGLTKFQEKIRDFFILGCLTGLRFSDFSTLTKQNFVGDYIIKPTKKTGATVYIPVSDYVYEIFEKYDENITLNLSSQHFNRYLKKICNQIGFDEQITFTQTIGGERKLLTKQKWQLITSHTARRSFATNTYISGRMKTYEIMAVTGHTTEKSFFRYIKISQENKVRQIAGDSFFRK